MKKHIIRLFVFAPLALSICSCEISNASNNDPEQDTVHESIAANEGQADHEGIRSFPNQPAQEAGSQWTIYWRSGESWKEGGGIGTDDFPILPE